MMSSVSGEPEWCFKFLLLASLFGIMESRLQECSLFPLKWKDEAVERPHGGAKVLDVTKP